MIGSYEEFARALEERPDGMTLLEWLAARADYRGYADWSLWLIRWMKEHPPSEWERAPLAQVSDETSGPC